MSLVDAATAAGTTRTVNVSSPAGDLARTVELPAEVFDVQVNVPLIHQVVVAQMAAALPVMAGGKYLSLVVAKA